MNAPAADAALATFAQRMRARRGELAMSQPDVADACGIGQAMVGAFERCNRRPSLLQAVRIATALDVTVGYLLNEPPGQADTIADEILDVLHAHGYARGARRVRSRVTGEPMPAHRPTTAPTGGEVAR